MFLNKTIQYAVQIVCYIAKKDKAKVITSEIANHTQATIKYLPKVLRILNRGGIVKSFRGIYGGYQLNKRPEDISVWDIIECFEKEQNITGPRYEMLENAEKEICKIYKNISIKECLVNGVKT